MKTSDRETPDIPIVEPKAGLTEVGVARVVGILFLVRRVESRKDLRHVDVIIRVPGLGDELWRQVGQVDSGIDPGKVASADAVISQRACTEEVRVDLDPSTEEAMQMDRQVVLCKLGTGDRLCRKKVDKFTVWRVL
jgi:hypothetical protein